MKILKLFIAAVITGALAALVNYFTLIPLTIHSVGFLWFLIILICVFAFLKWCLNRK